MKSSSSYTNRCYCISVMIIIMTVSRMRERESFFHSESTRTSTVMRNLFPWVFFSSFHLGWIKEFGVRRSLHRELSKRCTHSSTAESYSDLSLFFFFTTCTIFPGFCFCHVGFTSLFSSPLFLSSSTSFTIPLLHL